MGRALRAVVRAATDVHDAGDVDMGPVAAMGRICEIQDGGGVSQRILESGESWSQGVFAACLLSQGQVKIVGKSNRPRAKKLTKDPSLPLL